MEVVRAEKAGFCMGVILALRKLDSLIEKGQLRRPLYTLGAIIHNPQVLEEYTRKGVCTAETPEEIPPGAVAVIRAHGVTRDTKKRLRRRGVLVAEATCPKIKKAQALIRREAREGHFLLLYGEENHPEVKSLLSYAMAGAYLFETREKLGEFPLEPDGRYCLAAQTTQNEEIFEAIARDLTARPECCISVLRTICDATRQRQEEAIRIAREVDFMVVVGGFNSGNTRRLAQVVAAQNTPVIQVEVARGLPLEQLRGHSRIGLTAGASTPEKIIDEIQSLLENLS